MNHGVEWDVPWVYQSWTIKSIRDRLSFFLLKAVTRFSLNTLDRIVTNDRFFWHFQSLSKPHKVEHLRYIPNHFCPDFVSIPINTRSSIYRRVKSFASDSPLIYLPKMSMRERGTDIMISVCRLDPCIKLVISGTSLETNSYVEMVRQYNLQDRILFVHHISREHQAQIYHAADIVVIPSPCREATAIALLEAMAFRKPVVASEIGGLVEILHDHHNGLLCNADPSSFASAIKLLLSNSNLASYLSANAYNDVTKRFNLSAWETRFAMAFEQWP